MPVAAAQYCEYYGRDRNSYAIIVLNEVSVGLKLALQNEGLVQKKQSPEVATRINTINVFSFLNSEMVLGNRVKHLDDMPATTCIYIFTYYRVAVMKKIKRTGAGRAVTEHKKRVIEWMFF